MNYVANVLRKGFFFTIQCSCTSYSRCDRNHQGLLVNKVIVVKFSAKNEPFKFSVKDRGSRQHPRRHHQRRYPWCIHDPTVHRAQQMVMPLMKQLRVHTTVCLAIGRQLLQEGECRVDQVDGLLSRFAHSARGRANSIWRTRSFVCLAVAGQETPPSTAERIDLSLNGFGEKNNVS